MNQKLKDMPFDRLGPEAQYWHLLRQGAFMLQKSRSTGEFVHYPRLVAPKTGAQDLEWTPASGRGRVYSTTTMRLPPKLGGDFNISAVDLEEGPRLVGRVLGVEPDQVRIGMRVHVCIERVNFGTYAGTDQPIVVFRIREEESK